MGKETSIGFHHVFLPWSAVQGLVSIVYLCSKHKNDLAFRLVTKRTTERGSGRFSVPHAACSFHLIPEGFTSGENTSKVVYTRSHRFGSIEEHEARRVSLFRSEEHTSELQSHLNLVCRLLLEKKKVQITIYDCNMHSL